MSQESEMALNPVFSAHSLRGKITRATPAIKRLGALFGWRLAAMIAAATGSIWASRCLGAEALGISATVQALSAQLIIFTHFGLNNFLIRRYKTLTTREERTKLIEDVIVVRTVASLTITLAAAGYLVLHGIPPGWGVAIVAGIALFLLEAQAPDWLLQAQENQTAIYRSTLWGSASGSLGFFAFFRPGASAGSNLIVLCGRALIMRVLTYREAMAGLGKPRLRLKQMKAGLALVWEGRYFFATALVIFAYTQGEQLIVGYLRPVKELGVYKSAVQLMGAIQPLCDVISVMLYPRFIEWKKAGAMSLWHRQLKLGAIALGCWAVGSVAVLFVIPRAYPFIYGPEFVSGALPCALLIISKLLVVPVCVFVYSLWAHGRDKWMLIISTTAAAVSLSVNMILIPRFGLLVPAAMNLGAEAIMLCLGILLSRKLSRK